MKEGREMRMMDVATMGLNPYPWYEAMRAKMPMAYDPGRGSAAVFGYADVQRVLSEHATFSSAAAMGDDASPLGTSLIGTDPPRHRQLRNLVTQAFTPRAVAALAPRIERIVSDLLDTVAATGRMDVVADLAYPLPVIVIAELLGIPPENREEFKLWSDAVVSGPGSRGEGQAIAPSAAHQQMTAYFRRVIAARRSTPGDDLISGLLAAEIDGERLTEMELLGFCVLLLVAGNETTTNLIGNAMYCFDEWPETWERLRERPGLIPGAVEEVLRYRSPVQAMFRATVADAELGGRRIPAGTHLLAWIGSANRDGAQFPDADRFDVERAPNRHLAFGHGIHFCLGAPLARLEARLALEAMTRRMRNPCRAPGVELEGVGFPVVFGVRSLPVTFEPA